MNLPKGTLTIALPKGRLLTQSTALFRKLGFLPKDFKSDSRKLLFSLPGKKIRLVVIRAVDVPVYVEYGTADAGIVGKDVLLEQQPEVYEPLDLGFGSCRIVVAGPQTPPRSRGWSHNILKIATKYPRISERYFSEKGLPVEIIKLSGAIELSPLVGLSDQIVDLVTTGRTLKENQLQEIALVAHCTARLIINRASLKTKGKRIMELINGLEALTKADLR